jgi:hypothetical protein
MRTLLTAFSLGLVLTTAACGGKDQATRAINLRFNISGYGGKPFEIQLACDPPRASETGPGAGKEGVVWSTSNACRAIEAKPWLVGLAPIPPGEGRRTHCGGPDTGRNIAIEGTYRGERVKLRVNDCRDRRGLPLLELLGRVGHFALLTVPVVS